MSRHYHNKKPNQKPVEAREHIMTVKELLDKYELTRALVKKCFPPSRSFMIRKKNGMRMQIQGWTTEQVEKALQHPDIQRHFRKKQDFELELAAIAEIQQYYSNYSPDTYIEKAKKMRRSFVLHVGPTNSGKTYDAIEDLKSHSPGTYLGPLRLLALEMYDKINASGIPCSMITGEESLLTPNAEIVSSTIELADTRTHFRTAVIDEAQMIADHSRGAAWLRAICLVDADVIHVCMAPEALSYIEKLVQSFESPYSIQYHERLAPLSYTGEFRDYGDLRPGDALICFSRKSVLSTAALLEKNGYKASVIYGALPPEARRNEVRRYTSGETQYVVATDAIGMGISLPIKRIIFTETEKFDGRHFRNLTTAEINQIGGRAGRYGLHEYGEVMVLGDSPIIGERLGQKVRDIRAGCIAFPRDMLESDYSLRLLLTAWQKMPFQHQFLRENMSDAQILLKRVEKIKLSPEHENPDKKLLYDLITCPVDTKSEELIQYYVRCVKAILEEKTVPLPDFGMETLMDCELEYKAYDIRHQLLRRIGLPDAFSYMRERICDRISFLMLEDKGQYIRRCSVCGRELPIGSVFSTCDDCYFKEMVDQAEIY